MTDDSYITSEAVQAVLMSLEHLCFSEEEAEAVLRAVMPHLVPAIRADVLREVATMPHLPTRPEFLRLAEEATDGR